MSVDSLPSVSDFGVDECDIVVRYQAVIGHIDDLQLCNRQCSRYSPTGTKSSRFFASSSRTRLFRSHLPSLSSVELGRSVAAGTTTSTLLSVATSNVNGRRRHHVAGFLSRVRRHARRSCSEFSYEVSYRARCTVPLRSPQTGHRQCRPCGSSTVCNRTEPGEV